MKQLLLVVALGLGDPGPPISAAESSAVDIHVDETIGIRRRGYPVNARVPFPAGALGDAARVRLLFENREIGSQCAADAFWPDGSIQWLALDFNATLGPREEQVYRLEYGAGVSATPPARGLRLTQSSEAIQVGNVRFGRSGYPLFLSVKYRTEVIGEGANGFVVTDRSGRSHRLEAGEATTWEIVKPGPLYVVLRYTGRATIAPAHRVPFTITAEMPHSKSWVRLSARIEDPEQRLRDIALQVPLAFANFPWSWDFGTGSWTYGAMRGPRDSVVLTQLAGVRNEWRIRSGELGNEQPYEVAAAGRPSVAEGWGHFQDAREAVAFAVEEFGQRAGTSTVALDGSGLMTFRFTPESAGSEGQQIAVYLHFVATPPQVSAGTSPPSMLKPLTNSCAPTYYTKCGVQIPAEAIRREFNRRR